MNREELMRKIQQLSFAKCETELFLDTHPECMMALNYYNKIVGELDVAMEEYQNMYGPIVAEASGADKWSWVNGPWPWQNSDTQDLRSANGGKK
jgi:spore coat protein JB